MIIANTCVSGCTTGANWTSSEELGIWTIDAVDIACASSGGNCLMAYMRGSSNDAWIV